MTSTIPRILIVDDEPSVREYLADALSGLCQDICVAADLAAAIRCAELHPHDVLLADICMPGCSGIDLLQMAHQLEWDCAVILMTGHASLDQAVGGVRYHAADLLLKPFSLAALVQSVKQAYEKLLIARQRRAERELLSSGLLARTEELEMARRSLQESHRAALESLVATLEAREPQTHAHSFRVRAYALHLARLMNYPAAGLRALASAALLHDIGKIAVSDSILLKPGRLDEAEFAALKSHPVVGERIVKRIGFLGSASRIIRHHHERWDGRGYPDGLYGTEIPFGSRLFAVADTLDAMTSNRCYRNALGLVEARSEVARCAGTQFDPEIARLFATVSESCWLDLREQADADARAATTRGVNPDAALSFDQELVPLFPVTA